MPQVIFLGKQENALSRDDLRPKLIFIKNDFGHYFNRVMICYFKDDERHILPLSTEFLTGIRCGPPLAEGQSSVLSVGQSEVQELPELVSSQQSSASEKDDV